MKSRLSKGNIWKIFFSMSLKSFLGNSKAYLFFPLKDQKYLEKFQLRFGEGGGSQGKK